MHLLLIGLLSTQAQAADCANGSQMDLNICAGQSYQVADKALNDTYQLLLTKIDASQQEKLREAQRLWISFRDKECTFETSATEGGSIHSMMYTNCIQHLTEDRTKQLSALMNCQEGDMSCP